MIILHCVVRRQRGRVRFALTLKLLNIRSLGLPDSYKADARSSTAVEHLSSVPRRSTPYVATNCQDTPYQQISHGKPFYSAADLKTVLGQLGRQLLGSAEKRYFNYGAKYRSVHGRRARRGMESCCRPLLKNDSGSAPKRLVHHARVASRRDWAKRAEFKIHSKVHVNRVIWLDGLRP